MRKHLGTHIILDIYNVDMNCFQGEKLEWFLTKIIQGAWLQVLQEICHVFDESSYAFTSCVALSESHASIHTWPEEWYISADIFVSNFHVHNKHKALKAKDMLLTFLHASPDNVKQQHLNR